MNVLDLFSGIGGFSLGLERAGMRTVAFCEIEPFCRRVLAKHWPHVPCYDDVRTLTAERLVSDGIAVDVICGGFPCQDISVAGKGAGLAGERSGLWSEYARIIGEVRPRYIIVENVAALLGRGLSRVLGDLAALGYDAEWHCIPASAVGAPHRRDRVWIIADADSRACGEQYRFASSGTQFPRPLPDVAYSDRRGVTQPTRGHREVRMGPVISGEDVAHPAQRGRCLSCAEVSASGSEGAIGGCSCERDMADAECQRRGQVEFEDGRTTRSEGAAGPIMQPSFLSERGSGWWLVEPDVGRVAHGVPARVDRLRSLGNAVVPQIPEIIGRAIMRQPKPAKQESML